jgi:cytochrome P450
VTDGDRDLDGIPVVDLTDPEVGRDPFTAYGRAREQGPVARLMAPGLGPMWAVTRYDEARAMLADPRFGLSPASFLRPQVPEDCLPYLRTMQELEGAEHTRLRGLVAAGFSARSAERLRPRIEGIVRALVDDLPGQADGGQVDLVAGLAGRCRSR